MNSHILNTILLVDDDEISNLFNKIFIGKLNLEVEVDVALNGRKALNLLIPSEDYPAPLTPCLILLDIKMPIMNGWEFLKAYEKEVSDEVQNEITVVMLTTSMEEEDMVKSLNATSVKEVIQKPLSEKVIKRLIGTYFAETEIE